MLLVTVMWVKFSKNDFCTLPLCFHRSFIHITVFFNMRLTISILQGSTPTRSAFVRGERKAQ